MNDRRVIELTEHATTELLRSELAADEAAHLWQHFDKQLDVEYPSPRTGDRWRLTPKQWVGYLPVSASLGVALRPKLEVRSIFAMLEHAYDLESFRPLEGLHHCSSLEELYERIASILARRVRDRVRRGVYRAYHAESDALPFLRGRLDCTRHLKAPWRARIACQFEEHTADIEDNKLLLWALHLVARSGICSDRSAGHVRDAYRSLGGCVSLAEQEAAAYAARRYDRLNDDYRPMHALARFIVEHAGPRHAHGGRTMVPFLLDMAQLYEKFVAAWLAANIQPGWKLERQDHLSFGSRDRVQFRADLVIRDSDTEKPLIVLDTKYKRHACPASDDLAQIVAYATAWGTTDAVLIYPEDVEPAWEATVGSVRVRALSFALDGDLDGAGARFLAALGPTSKNG